MTRLRSALAWVLVAAGSAGIAYPGVAYASGALRQARLAAEVRTIVGTAASTARGEDLRASSVDAGREPSAPAPAGARGLRWGPAARRAARPVPVAIEGQALGLLRIPAIGLETVFLEGVSERVLRVGPGHLPGTTLPGGPGVSVLAAHRDAHFRGLKDLGPGDRVALMMPSGQVAYRVAGRRIADPDDAWVTRPRPRDVLRLVTCWPPAWIGPAPRRLVVSAVPVTPPGEAAAANRESVGRQARAGGRTLPVRLVGPPSAPGVEAEASTTAGTAGAAVALMAAFGALRTRRGLAWWFLPWTGGLGLAALALLASWAGRSIASPI